eukprot:1104950-Alexandrium_andersonii.AAC.1
MSNKCGASRGHPVAGAAPAGSDPPLPPAPVCGTGGPAVAEGRGLARPAPPSETAGLALGVTGRG